MVQQKAMAVALAGEENMHRGAKRVWTLAMHNLCSVHQTQGVQLCLLEERPGNNYKHTLMLF